MAAKKADQGLFEKKAIKKILPAYKRCFSVSSAEVSHVDTLERLGNLENYGVHIGGLKIVRPLTIGGLLNNFNKSVVSAALTRFLVGSGVQSSWQFIIDITSSTAMYVIFPGPWVPDDDGLVNCRFTAELNYVDSDGCNNRVILMRLDDYTSTLFPQDGV